MHSLFRAFSRRRVRTLVIGGQAAILYGAAHFTQDLDLWVDPDDANVRRFLQALADLKARVHKLTPPMERRHVRAGHGFHFIVPQSDGPLYLDAMGVPPRSRSFTAAWKRAERFTTPWGRIPVVGIEDLVELKKTNRPADYDVITRLAVLRVARSTSPSVLKWAAANIFRVEDLWGLVETHGIRGVSADPAVRALRRAEALGPQTEAAARILAVRAQRLQEEGRRYWLPRIAELRELRASGGLIEEGRSVASLL